MIEEESGKPLKLLIKLYKIDMSSTLMNATCKALNNMELHEYLNEIFDSKHMDKIWLCSLLLLCCSHFVHMVRMYAKKMLNEKTQSHLINFIIEILLVPVHL